MKNTRAIRNECDFCFSQVTLYSILESQKEMAVALKLGIFDLILMESKCVWEAEVFREIKIELIQLFVYNFFCFYLLQYFSYRKLWECILCLWYYLWEWICQFSTDLSSQKFWVSFVFISCLFTIHCVEKQNNLLSCEKYFVKAAI